MMALRVKPDRFFKQVVAAAFPDYRGRKFKFAVQDRGLDVRDYWDGGSRTYFVFVNLATMETAPMPEQGVNNRPVKGAEEVWLPEGFACVERSWFCGKDCGVTVTVNPANAPKVLVAA